MALIKDMILENFNSDPPPVPELLRKVYVHESFE
jgi:hypothetical protein